MPRHLARAWLLAPVPAPLRAGVELFGPRLEPDANGWQRGLAGLPSPQAPQDRLSKFERDIGAWL